MNKYCRHSKNSLFIYMVLNIITAVLSVAIALIIELTINIVSTEQMDDFRRIVFGALIFIVLYFGFNYLRNFYMQRMINRYIGQLRSLLFRKIMSYSFVGFRKSSTSDYLSLLTNDIQIYQEGIARSKLCVVQNVISATIVLLALLGTNISITFLIITCTVIIYFLPRLFNKKISLAQEKVSKRLALITGTASDYLEGFYVISTYNYQEKAGEKFDSANEKYYEKKNSLDKNLSKSETFSSVLSVATELLVLFVSAQFVFMNILNVGEMVAVMQLTGAFVQPLILIMTNLPKISGGRAIEERFLSILTVDENDRGNQKEESALLLFEKDIELCNISFSYEGQKEILHEIYLKIRKGKKYAVVGGSGAGKTTLINLINGIYKQNAGNILVDGCGIENKYRQYINLFATVGQNTFLFHSTVQENITLTEKEDAKRLVDACTISGVLELIQDQKCRLEQVIQENGANLSGGQKQKIALARAVYHEKPILILDEGMSAIDKKSAYDIEKRLLSRKNVTLLSITHDIHSPLLKEYDEIIFLVDGGIEMAGSYNAVFEHSEKFREFLNGTG